LPLHAAALRAAAEAAGGHSARIFVAACDTLPVTLPVTLSVHLDSLSGRFHRCAAEETTAMNTMALQVMSFR